MKINMSKNFLSLIFSGIFIIFSCSCCYAVQEQPLTKLITWSDKQNITIWIEPHKYSYIVYNSFMKWQNAANGCLRFRQAKSQNDANIVVYFSDEDYPRRGHSVVHEENNIMLDVKIYIIKRNIKNMKDLEFISLHEIGHALGIIGHPERYDSIMTFDYTELQKADIYNIRQMYCK